MADVQAVCCMCGDVGFPDKLFRCNKCHYRFQHLYCSNYYTESSEPIELCDWCQSEGKISRHGGSSSKKSSNDTGSRSEYSGDKMIKQNDHREDQGGDKGKNPATGAPSPRTATRRYKLLKDVMC
ncbi:hypothetical protein LguiA_010254 [Lonicera macranthoides]